MKKLTFILMLIAASVQAQITLEANAPKGLPCKTLYKQSVDTIGNSNGEFLNISTDGDSVFYVNEKGERFSISGGGSGQYDLTITPGSGIAIESQWPKYLTTPPITYYYGRYDDLIFVKNEAIEKTKWTEKVTVLNPGDTVWCDHEYINSGNNNWDEREDGILSLAGGSCLVIHGPCGCSYEWPHFRRICKKCLRHEEVEKTCEEIHQPKPLNYFDYLKQLNEK